MQHLTDYQNISKTHYVLRMEVQSLKSQNVYLSCSSSSTHHYGEGAQAAYVKCALQYAESKCRKSLLRKS